MTRRPSLPVAVYLTTAALFVVGCWRVYVLKRPDIHEQWWRRQRAVNSYRKAGVL